MREDVAPQFGDLTSHSTSQSLDQNRIQRAIALTEYRRVLFSSTTVGTPALAEHLVQEVPSKISATSEDNWAGIARELDAGKDLESALLAVAPNDDVELTIGSVTASFISEYEKRVFRRVIEKREALRFSLLLKVLVKEPSGIPVITTNYDRLIELAAELEGLGVNSTFVGHRAGQFDPKGSGMSLCRDVNVKTKIVRKEYCDHIHLFKPHGSLDWYHTPSGPTRCVIELDSRRLMITPGLNKYLSGYKPPFDWHIGKANEQIDKAARFLIIGYGFNDEHLQTHITPRLRSGTQAIIITRSLTEQAKKLLPEFPGTIAVTKQEGGTGTTIVTSSSAFNLAASGLWDLETFVREIWKI